MTRPFLLILLTIVALGVARPAGADLTAFWGTTQSPSNRTTRGAALGISLALVGFEFEYSDASDEAATQAPSLRSGMFNLLLQTPFAVSRVQFYATVGGGLYRERISEAQTTGFGTNIGAGVKVSLVGPLRIRLDYRAFRLTGDAVHSTPQRVYAGLNVGF